MTQSLALISHHLCPFVQRAAVVLLEKGVAFERVSIDLHDKPAWFLTISPLGKVPLLKVTRPGGSEVVLFESMAICEYLEETLPGDPLYPSDPLERAQARAWVEFGTATLQDAWGFLNAKDETTAEERRKGFRQKLERLNGVIAEPYFAGQRFSMIDVVFAPVFRYFDLMDPAISDDIFADLGKVAIWRQALARRPSVGQAVGEDYLERLLAHLSRASSRLAA